MEVRGCSDGLESVTCSRDGRRLATGTFEGTVKIWDLVSQKEILQLQGHTDPVVIDVAFLPDDTPKSISIESTCRWHAPKTL